MEKVDVTMMIIDEKLWWWIDEMVQIISVWQWT